MEIWLLRNKINGTYMQRVFSKKVNAQKALKRIKRRVSGKKRILDWEVVFGRL